MAIQRIITEDLKIQTVQNWLDHIDSAGSNNYSGMYVFAGRSIPWEGSDANVASPVDTTSQVVDVYQNMIFGKQLTAQTVFPMVNRYDWIVGTIYSPYDPDTQIEDYTTPFYVGVDETAFYHVFKCLDNNGGVPSQVAPRVADTSAADVFYQTSDGYIWKYMYSIDRSTMIEAATMNFIPVLKDANVSSNAISGTIDVVAIVDGQGGSGYNQYLEGQFNSSDIKIGGDATLYGLNKDASSANDFYVGCYLVVIEGAAKGQYQLITDYKVQSNAKQVTLDSPFTITPDTTSQWQITPALAINGDGHNTKTANARALVNAVSSNSVYSVEILDRGAGYSFANAVVITNSLNPISNAAVLKCVIPPIGGHGANACLELGATRLGVTVNFANSESNTISTQNDFRVVGLIDNPQFANMQLTVVDSLGNPGSNGTFVVNETILTYQPIMITGSVSINTTSNTIIGNGTDFTDALRANNTVMISSNGQTFVSVVSSVINAIAFVTNTTPNYTSSNAGISIIVPSTLATVTGVSFGALNITNVRGQIQDSSRIVGLTSYSTANVTTYTINGKPQTQSTFSQLKGYVGTLTSGAFSEDELVTQSSTGATGYFHSLEQLSGQPVVYLVNEIGIFNVGDVLEGTNSGATFAITNKFGGDIVPYSGQIMYIENIEPIVRDPQQSETIKTVLEF